MLAKSFALILVGFLAVVADEKSSYRHLEYCPECEDLLPDYTFASKFYDKISHYLQFIDSSSSDVEKFIKFYLSSKFTNIWKNGYCCHLTAFVKSIEESICDKYENKKKCSKSCGKKGKMSGLHFGASMPSSYERTLAWSLSFSGQIEQTKAQNRPEQSDVLGSKTATIATSLRLEADLTDQHDPNKQDVLSNFTIGDVTTLAQGLGVDVDMMLSLGAHKDRGAVGSTREPVAITKTLEDLDYYFFEKCLFYTEYAPYSEYLCLISLFVQKTLDACLCSYSAEGCAVEKDCTDTLKFNVDYASRRAGQFLPDKMGNRADDVVGPCNSCTQSKFPCAGYCNYVRNYDRCDVVRILEYYYYYY